MTSGCQISGIDRVATSFGLAELEEDLGVSELEPVDGLLLANTDVGVPIVDDDGIAKLPRAVNT